MLESILLILKEYGIWGLMLITFLDSFISPIPPEVLFIPICIVTPGKAPLFAIITIAVSVIGATLGYWLGLKGGRPLLFKFFSQDKIQKGENLIQTHGIMAVLITSFTPIPYKLITVSSGVLGLSLKKLIFWSTIGRGARFFLEAVLIMVYGRAVKDFLLGSTFSFFTLVIGIISLIIYFLYIIRKRKT